MDGIQTEFYRKFKIFIYRATIANTLQKRKGDTNVSFLSLLGCVAVTLEGCVQTATKY